LGDVGEAQLLLFLLGVARGAKNDIENGGGAK